MGKKNPLKDKPKMPSNEEILQDLARAPKSDIVFRLSLDGSKYSTLLQPDGCSSNSLVFEHAINPQTDKQGLEETYDRLSTFIEKFELLQEEPKILKNKYEHLQQLGEDVSESISELKSAAENLSGENLK